LCVELGETGLAIVIEDKDGVDHCDPEQCFSSESLSFGDFATQVLVPQE